MISKEIYSSFCSSSTYWSPAKSELNAQNKKAKYSNCYPEKAKWIIHRVWIAI